MPARRDVSFSATQSSWPNTRPSRTNVPYSLFPIPCSNRPRWGKMPVPPNTGDRSEEHTSELQSLLRISYAVFCLKKKKTTETSHVDSTNQNKNNNIPNEHTPD